MVFTPEVIWETFLMVLTAVPRTLLLAVVILFFGIILGLLIAILKRKQLPGVTTVLNIFISYMRGVPLIIHLLILQGLLPEAGASLLSIFGITTDPNNFPSVLIVLITYIALDTAIEAQNIYGAFQSIDYRQIEAGYSIGFTRKQNYQRIIIPQLIATVTPLFLNSFLKMIKALSLAFTVGVVDIVATARYAAALNYRYFESYIAAALVYWLLCGILQFIFSKIEKRMQFN